MTPDEMECFLIRSDEITLLNYCMRENIVPREFFCTSCGSSCKLSNHKRSSDLYAWRCYNSTCFKRKEYFSVRKNSFFEGFSLSLQLIMRIVAKFGTRQSVYSIKRSLDLSKNSVDKVVHRLITKMPRVDFSNNKLGGPGFVVQIDETMLNYKVKSHRGRSPTNRTDSLCIVETDGNIKRAFACVIPNKRASTLVPIICSQVASNSMIHTDEHKSYSSLGSCFSSHGVVCHKYEFVNHVTGVNTQAIESFHNELKLEIKKRKGISTNKRSDFLNEFCYYFNNRHDYFDAIQRLMLLN